MKHRIKTLGDKLLTFTKVGFRNLDYLTISGSTIIEFKNCIVKANSFDSLSILKGDAPKHSAVNAIEEQGRVHLRNLKFSKTTENSDTEDNIKPVLVERKPKIFIKGCHKAFSNTCLLSNGFHEKPKKLNKAFEMWKQLQVSESPSKPSTLFLGKA